MRTSSKLALGALIAGIVLFVAALPLGNHGWEKTAGGTLFALSLAAALFSLAGVYSLTTKSRARTEAGRAPANAR